MKTQRWELSERQLKVLGMREEGGCTYLQIGEAVGVGVTRAQQIYHEAKAKRKRLEDPEDRCVGLGSRALNVLSNGGIRTVEEAREAYEMGRLRGFRYRVGRWGVREPRGIRGLGPETLKEIARWAGIELPKEVEKKRCRLCGKVL